MLQDRLSLFAFRFFAQICMNMLLRRNVMWGNICQKNRDRNILLIYEELFVMIETVSI